ncbi:carboxylate-amine ligase [Kibdelosporangium phytohabitans]|uniref:carboxylate-amine ligase n=1 Tax=Kibdelosporangium phytohabitans TaxID=860235 RepID=UPI000AFBDF2E|nr:YbdK family carboxylate-amine ligase [Kibdelosporangium phytohabitans]MBE1463504.1 carboxylate-amine ligase [Kibdelosporangium phytohabitans]
MVHTFGVEEEFLVVDRASRHTVARAGAVLKRAAAGVLPRGAALHPELLSSQVEFASGVCTSMTELHEHLLTGRRLLAEAARGEGLAVVSSGTAALSPTDLPVSDGTRFERITTMYAKVLQDYQVSGCHVHIGVPDRDTAVAVINHLSPWMPVLLALSANSPYDSGKDTGYASWRMIQQSRLPGGGLTPWFGSAAAFDEATESLVDWGVLADDTMSFWLARPSPRYPTVEVRVADAAATADEAVLQCALTRGLVRYALAELAAGREARPVDGQRGAAALWSAARHGLDGPGIDVRTGQRADGWGLVKELVDMLDDSAVRDLVDKVTGRGTGVRRQRQAGNPVAAVDELMTAMEER